MEDERFRTALEHADDGIVAGRAMDGDVEAFAVLVRRYTPMMRAYTQRMLNASADVDDIVQESFVTAWQRFGELEDPAKVKSWLMRIVSRKAVDRIRAIRPAVDIDSIVRLHCMPHRPRSSRRVRASPPSGQRFESCRMRSANAGCCGRSAGTPTRRSPRSSTSPSRPRAACSRGPGNT